MSAEKPPEETSFLWCPLCGRDDRYKPFTGGQHYIRGKKCGGIPVKVTYVLKEKQT